LLQKWSFFGPPNWSDPLTTEKVPKIDFPENNLSIRVVRKAPRGPPGPPPRSQLPRGGFRARKPTLWPGPKFGNFRLFLTDISPLSLGLVSNLRITPFGRIREGHVVLNMWVTKTVLTPRTATCYGTLHSETTCMSGHVDPRTGSLLSPPEITKREFSYGALQKNRPLDVHISGVHYKTYASSNRPAANLLVHTSSRYYIQPTH
jgi:hypothetical protein